MWCVCELALPACTSAHRRTWIPGCPAMLVYNATRRVGMSGMTDGKMPESTETGSCETPSQISLGPRCRFITSCDARAVGSCGELQNKIVQSQARTIAQTTTDLISRP